MNHFLSMREIRTFSERMVNLDQVNLETYQASVPLSMPTNLGSQRHLSSRWQAGALCGPP